MLAILSILQVWFCQVPLGPLLSGSETEILLTSVPLGLFSWTLLESKIMSVGRSLTSRT